MRFSKSASGVRSGQNWGSDHEVEGERETPKEAVVSTVLLDVGRGDTMVRNKGGCTCCDI
jgi:hypothetical protein